MIESAFRNTLKVYNPRRRRNGIVRGWLKIVPQIGCDDEGLHVVCTYILGDWSSYIVDSVRK